jgi:hypothetical protein
VQNNKINNSNACLQPRSHTPTAAMLRLTFLAVKHSTMHAIQAQLRTWQHDSTE